MATTGLIYAIYGLAFFSLGLSVIARSVAFARSEVRNRFLSLGLFGFLHGAFEWLIWANLAFDLHLSALLLQFPSAASFLALAYFGLAALFPNRALSWKILITLAGLWLIGGFLAPSGAVIEVMTRWGLAVPTAALAGYVFLTRKSLTVPDRKTQWAANGAAVAFLSYAVLQVFLTPGPGFPASVINTTWFTETFGLSVLIARTLSAIAMMTAALTLLDTFDSTIREEARHRYQQALEKLKLSDNTLKSVFALAPVGIMISRLNDQEILEANPALLATLGLEAKSLTSLRQLDRLGAEIANDLTRQIRSYGHVEPLEFDYLRKSGERVTLLIEGASLADEEEELAILVTQDITPLRRNNRLLEQKRAEAEAANVAKSQFLANMSHEIRTPLNAIIGLISVLKRSELKEKQQAMLSTVEDAGNTLLNLLNDILDLSRIEAGEFKLDHEPVNMLDIAERTIELHRSRAVAKGLDINLHAPENSSAIVMGDATRLHQVLSNLVSNAIKFTDVGGITVSLASERIDKSQQSYSISVRDTGIGIASGDLVSIFDRFTQADGASTRRHGGSGLGLAIVSGLVRAMGGQIDAQSTPGDGSEFIVQLTFVRAPAVPHRPNTKVPGRDLSRPGRILVVDDDELNHQTFRAMLNGSAWSASFASSGFQATEIVLTNEFDLIVLDLHMPEMDGFDTLSAIRKIEHEKGRAATPVIACTADAFKETRNRCDQAGFATTLTKPVSIDQFLAAISHQA